jgi:hypothetical protein
MTRNRLATIAFACVLTAGSSAVADVGDGSIGVYLDAAGTQCSGTITGTVIGSVWMNLAGASASGVSGVEFRIDNSNAAAYSVSFVADPATTIVIGNPFFAGVNMGWAACQTGTGGRVKLGELIITENTSSPDVTMTVRQHYYPSNPSPQFQCALVTQCDGPAFTKVCVSATNSDHWRAVMNPSGAISGDCEPVAVAPSTWSVVKSMYGQ